MITIAALNYVTLYLSVDCLETYSTSLPDNCNVMIGDICSNNDSVAIIKDHVNNNLADDRFHVVLSSLKSGFKAGNNFGIPNHANDHLVSENSNTPFRKEAIQQLIDAAETKPGIAQFNPRLEWTKGKAQVSYFRNHHPAIESILATQTGPSLQWFSQYIASLPQSEQPTQPEWISFAGAMIHRQVFESFSLLDEDFFMYLEDLEFCHKARQAGWEILDVPSAHVGHLRGGTSPVKADFMARNQLSLHYFASPSRYYYLLYGKFDQLLANLLWIAGRSISKARELLERRFAHIPDKQWHDIWINWRARLQGMPPVLRPGEKP